MDTCWDTVLNVLTLLVVMMVCVDAVILFFRSVSFPTN